MLVAAIWLACVHPSSLALFPALLGGVVLLLASVGMVNAVNITDGLDGLAGGAFMISLCALSGASEGWASSPNWAALFGMTAGFLMYNARPARLFMGDTGSHFLGGALVSLCLTSGNVFVMIPVGFLFWVELLSSAIQIASIRLLHRKVFLMAPLHHHFQRRGWDETTVTWRFLVAHAAGAALLSGLDWRYLL
jgi:phospho-N-acetylmuramoyl-pentapeptide-transferase